MTSREPSGEWSSADGARIKRHQAPGVALLFSYVAPTKIYGQGWRSTFIFNANPRYNGHIFPQHWTYLCLVISASRWAEVKIQAHTLNSVLALQCVQGPDFSLPFSSRFAL